MQNIYQLQKLVLFLFKVFLTRASIFVSVIFLIDKIIWSIAMSKKYVKYK